MTSDGAWPADAVAFLEELEANNDREWFRANKGRWERTLRDPAHAIGEALKPEFGAFHTFRPYNDTRFHARPPIKEQFGLVLGEGAAAHYVELSLDGLFLAAGMWMAQPDQVSRLRAAIDDDRTGAALVGAVEQARAAGFELREADLKRVPRGFDADHPRAELLRHKRFVVQRRHPLEPWIHRAGAVERIRDELRAASPVVDWLRQTVGPSTSPRSR